jgi:hypothetical protein
MPSAGKVFLVLRLRSSGTLVALTTNRGIERRCVPEPRQKKFLSLTARENAEGDVPAVPCARVSPCIRSVSHSF